MNIFTLAAILTQFNHNEVIYCVQFFIGAVKEMNECVGSGHLVEITIFHFTC